MIHMQGIFLSFTDLISLFLIDGNKNHYLKYKLNQIVNKKWIELKQDKTYLELLRNKSKVEKLERYP